MNGDLRGPDLLSARPCDHLRGGTEERQEMKVNYSKIGNVILSAALCTLLSGCITYSTVQEAEGRPENAMWVWGHNQLDPNSESKPQPAYYALMLLSVPADIATAPVQVVILTVGAIIVTGQSLRR